jgi:UTP-glucose-1-phosphate uridylyltransferase
MKDKSLVILAAGIGSRYGGFKQMDPVGPSGEFIIDYSVYDAVRAGFNKVVYLISREIEADFKASIGARTARHVAVEYAFQDAAAFLPPDFTPPPDRRKPWGTAHALMACRDHAQNPFAVVNADDFYGAESYRTLADFLDATAAAPDLYAMVGFVLGHTVSRHGRVARGLCQADDEGFLKTIVERTRIECRPNGEIGYIEEDAPWTPLGGRELVSMNFWGFKPSIFPCLERDFTRFLKKSGQDVKAEYFIPTVVGDAIDEGRCRVKTLRSNGEWFGVTYPQDKAPVVARIGELIAQGVYPDDLWA